MPDSPADDPILKRFRAALDTLYGHPNERMALLGSQPRGDAREDFDYEVAVLKGLANRSHQLDCLVPLVTDIVYEDGSFIPRPPVKISPR